VVPDVYVVKVEDRYVIQLNEEGFPGCASTPITGRSSARRKTSTKRRGVHRGASPFRTVADQGMDQRNKTIYKVAESIVKFQTEFLEQGITRLKPMVLKDVAEDISMHESTVSRVTTNKHMHTRRGSSR